MKFYTIHELKVGDSAHIKKRFSEADVLQFAEVSNDFNPAHLDQNYASQTIFKKPIVHGMLVSSLFSAIFGVQMPGLGSIYTKQSLKFTKPVYLNDEITAQVTVKELQVERNRVTFECVATNEQGDVVVVGEAEIMPPRGK